MLETNKQSIQIDPYPCAIFVKNQFYDTSKTVGHIPREIPRHVHYFIKEGGAVIGRVFSTKYRQPPIPSGGLEIPLMLKFSCSKVLMKKFVQNLYDYNFTGTVTEEESDDDEVELLVESEEPAVLSQ